MMSLRLTLFCVVLVVINVNASVSDEDKAKISKAHKVHITSCSQERGVSEEEIKTTGLANNIDPCVAKCLLMKTRVIDGNGKWDVDRANELNQIFFPSIAKDIPKEQLESNCPSLKDVVFGKSDDDCDMALTVFECSSPFEERLLAFN